MPTGASTTYALTVGVKLEVEDMIYILTPTDVPLLGTFNGTDNLPPGPRLSILNTETVSEKKVEWQEETLLTARSTLNGAITNSQTTITVATGDGIKFQTGSVLRINAEAIRVLSVAGDVLTVTGGRGFASTTAAAASSGDAVIGIGTALPEGSDPQAARVNDRVMQNNFTEIFGPYKIETSATERVIDKYGVSDEHTKQISNRVREIAVEIEQALLYGVRLEDTGGAALWRTMGGLVFYITTNVDAATAAVTEAKVLDQLQNSYNNGGVIDTILVNATQKRNISAFSSTKIQIAQADRIRGQVVDQYWSDFGVADLVLNRHMKLADIIGIDRQWVSVCTLRPLVVEPLAKTGDADKSQIVCEKSMKVRMEKRHFRFSALTS